jgi:hypothetical protein
MARRIAGCLSILLAAGLAVAEPAPLRLLFIGNSLTFMNDVPGLLAAGDAWREAWQLDARLPVYSPDGFHASLLGSQLAALVVEGVTGQPATVLPFGLPASRSDILRQAADRARTKGR